MRDANKARLRLRELAPVRLIITLVCCLCAGVLRALRADPEAMRSIYEAVTRPYHDFMSRACAGVSFSAAEALIAVVVVSALVYVVVGIIGIARNSDTSMRVYRLCLTLLMTASVFWAGFAALWTPCYYAPTFSERSGVSSDPVSVEQLRAVTEYFAGLANEYSAETERNAEGVSFADRDSVLDRAAQVYGGISELWPFLENQPLRPKGIICSKVMSLMDFTGFFFPLTGEANVNMDSPSFLLPATAEHEISHQRGIALEQECNFLAVAACVGSDYAEFRYSGALLAYIYLGNALYGADYDGWREIAASLSDGVRADLSAQSEYWSRFDTAVRKASNSAYEGFLIDNGQTLGLQSYGACVDLLVNYYYGAAA